MVALSSIGSASLDRRQQLQQGQHVFADGHRDSFIPSLRHAPAAFQRQRFPGDLRLLRVHLHGRP